MVGEISLERMVEASDAIAIGEVTGARAMMIDREAVTLFTIEVEEMLKGEAHGPMTLMLPGGVVPGAPVPIARVPADVPRIQVGDEAVWFMTDALSSMVLTSFAAGFMPIVEGTLGERLVSAEGVMAGGAGEGVGLVDLMREPAPPPDWVPMPPQPDTAPSVETPGVPLEEMRDRILDLIR